MRLKIIIAAYDCEKWIKNNITELIKQKHKDWDAVVIDDCSTDSTPKIIKSLIKGHDNIQAIYNKERIGALKNQVIGIETLKPEDEDVIVIIDGDDWLANDGVFTILEDAYKDPNVWMTYGNYLVWPLNRKGTVCKPIPENHNPRLGRWLFSHLRTFKYFLFKNLSRSDFRFTGTDTFYTSTGDCAVMKPLAEMAGPKHIIFIDKILLIYNFANPLGDGIVNKSIQAQCGKDISEKEPYTLKTKDELLRKEHEAFS